MSHARLVRGLRDHESPGIDDQRAPMTRSQLAVTPALGGRQDERLVLDGARPEQDLPVVLAGLRGEGARHREEAGATLRQRAVELRESQVVADGQSDRAERRVEQRQLLPRRDGGRLDVGVAAARAQIDVEEMDLPIDRSDLAVRGAAHAGVVDASVVLARLGKAAAHEPEAKLARPGAQSGHDFAVERLGAGNGMPLAAQIGEILGQRDELCAASGRFPHQRVGRGEIRRQIVHRGHLYDAGQHDARR